MQSNFASIQLRHRSHHRSLFAAFLIASCLGGFAPTRAAAQYSMVEDLAPRFEWSGRLQAAYQAEFETKTDGGDEFEAWRASLAGDFGGPVSDVVLIGFHARYAHAEYDFRLDNGTFPSTNYGTNEFPKDPWGGLDTIDMMPTTTILLGDRISIMAAVPIRWSSEVGSERNAFMAGISGLASWQVVDRLRIGLGIGITSQVEGGTETFPIIALDWRITESVRLATEGNWMQGGNAGFFWEPNEALTLSFSAGFERNRFRLDNNGTLPDTNGVGEIRTVPIEFGLRLRVAERAHIDVRAGLGVAGRFRVENDRGQKLYDQNYDPAPRLRVGLTLPIGPIARSEAGRAGGRSVPVDPWEESWDDSDDSTNSW